MGGSAIVVPASYRTYSDTREGRGERAHTCVVPLLRVPELAVAAALHAARGDSDAARGPHHERDAVSTYGVASRRASASAAALPALAFRYATYTAVAASMVRCDAGRGTAAPMDGAAYGVLLLASAPRGADTTLLFSVASEMPSGNKMETPAVGSSVAPSVATDAAGGVTRSAASLPMAPPRTPSRPYAPPPVTCDGDAAATLPALPRHPAAAVEVLVTTSRAMLPHPTGTPAA